VSGPAIAINSQSVTSSTQIQANITVPSGGPLGPRNVTVTTTPGGGGTATLTNGFTVSSAVVNTTTGLTGPISAAYGTPTTFTATVTASSGTPTGDVQFKIDGVNSGSPVTLSGGAATFSPTLDAGGHTITADYLGATGFNGSSDSAAITVSQLSQTISFGAIAGKTFGDPSFVITISGGGSGNPVTLTSSGDITLSTNSVPSTGGSVTVTITGAGAASITADQAGNTNYTAAIAVVRNFTVAKATPVISFSQADRSFNDGNFTLSATSTPSLPITFALLNSPTGVSVASNGSVTVTSPQDTDASVQVRASFAGNDDYNPAEATDTFLVKENVGPTTTKQVTQGTLGTNGWYKSGPDVVVKLMGSDSGSGVDHISYTIDGVDQPDVNDFKEFVTLTADGTHTIAFTVYDANGNSTSDSIVIKLDRTGPVITASPARSTDHNGWFNHDVVIDFSATDATSGGAALSAPSALLTGTADANKSVSVDATDAAGNTSSETFSYQFDATAPVVVVGGVSQGGSYHDGSVSALTVTEPYEASRNMWISNPNTAAGAFYDYATQSGQFTAVASLPLNLTVEGNYTLHVVVEDQAGNESVQDVQFTVDQDAPTINVMGVINGGKYNASPLGVSWSISDDFDFNPVWLLQSLFADVASQNGLAFVNSTAAELQVAPGLGQEGMFKLNLSGKDAAGNIRAIDEITFFIDYNAPLSGAVVQNGTAGTSPWYTSLVEALVSASDPNIRDAAGSLGAIPGTGVALLEYSLDGLNWLPLPGVSGLISLATEGTNTIRTRSTDSAGNQESSHDALVVQIDTVKPFFTAIPNVDGGRATARGGKSVTFDLPTAGDATSGVASVVTVPASGDNFPVGTTMVSATVTDNAGLQKTEQFEVKVGKIIQTITFNPQTTAVYGDAPVTLTATTNATGPAIPVTFTVSGAGHLGLDGKLVIDSAGTITITASAAGDGEFEAATDVVRTITVAKKAITVTAQNETKVYGAANPTLGYDVEGLVGSDTISGITVTLSDPAAHVTTGAVIDVSGPLETSNYLVSYIDGALTVTPAPLTITTNHATREYGLANPTFTATIDGLVNGDGAIAVGTVTFTTSATQLSPIGTYSVTPGGASSTDYTIAFVAGSLCITKANLTVVPNDANRLYGDANPTLTGVVSGARNGDSFSVTYQTAATPASPVGSYAILVASVTGDAIGNYNVDSSATADLEVNPAPLTVTPDNVSITYGDLIPDPLGGTIEGIKNGDDITASYSTSATSSSDAGTYAIVATLNDPNNLLGNYEVTNTPGTLTIGKATPVITWSPAGNIVLLNASVSATSSGVAPLGLSVTSGPGTLQPNGSVKATDVGSIVIRAQAAETTNYLAVDVAKTYASRFASTSGVLQPINQDGTSVVKKGSTLPVKIKVFDVNGVSIGAPGTILGLQRFNATNGVFGTVNEEIISTTPDSNFRWDATAQQWIFNLSTSNLASGTTYTYRIALKDGTYVEFKFGTK
jgi:hypothetical protein